MHNIGSGYPDPVVAPHYAFQGGKSHQFRERNGEAIATLTSLEVLRKHVLLYNCDLFTVK